MFTGKHCWVVVKEPDFSYNYDIVTVFNTRHKAEEFLLYKGLESYADGEWFYPGEDAPDTTYRIFYKEVY